MHRVKKYLVVMLIFLACGLQVAASESVNIVKSGNVISQEQSASIAQLAEWNHLNSDLLHVDNKVMAQVSGSNSGSNQASTKVAAAPATSLYIVKSGDSLWSIARNYNTTVDVIMALNSMNNEKITIGDQIKVTGQASPVTVAKVKDTRSASKKKSSVTVASTDQPSRSGSLAKAGTILGRAAQYLGTPYRYGGGSPSGFDCSGFTQYVYRQFGYSLPRTAAGQGSVGVSVKKGNLKPGDLVLFACNGSGGISHVGIYAGNGQFIHSSSPRSGGVIYSSLNEDYYASSYVGARRVLP